MNKEERKQEIINEINIKLHDYPNLFFDDSVDMPSINNRIKEFSDEEPIWEDYSDEDDLELENCSEDDLSNLLWDFNAAKNIRNRVLVTVLRESLLKQMDNGAFEPKKLKREKVKEVLLSFRRNLQENARSEYRESRLTTFDYI